MRQANSPVPLAGRIVQKNLVGRLCPDCGEFNGSRTVQNKLETAAAAILLQFQFAHWKMVFQQVLFATQSYMHKMSQMVQRANLGRRFGKMWSSDRLTHAETALTEK